MADDVKESKAQKLAAARKKLKEYQKRGLETVATNMSTSTTSVASSERSDFDVTEKISNETPKMSLENYFGGTGDFAAEDTTPAVVENDIAVSFSNNADKQNSTEYFCTDNHEQQQINAIQVLINEKAQLTIELQKLRASCREKDVELEEVRLQSAAKMRDFQEIEKNFNQQQQSTETLRKHNAELMHKLSQANAHSEDQSTHLTELQEQLKLSQNRINELEEKYKEKCNEHEIAQLRIQQLSNDTNTDQDNRVEALTKNQFMYEQQIRDLQAMVQQFTQDKEQASVQYQNYVQHLNAEVSTVNERNSELTDECIKLQERERQLVEHISELEKEIQKNLSLRKKCDESNNTPPEPNNIDVTSEKLDSVNKEKEQLQEKLNDFEFERLEFQLKIKSQEDRIEQFQRTLSEKQQQLDRMQDCMAEQPDQAKLLATMESDKIAASRAVTQNVELKKQLDELEVRFVQLTNDKAELTNKLDAEEYANREMRNNYAEMETRIHNLDERFQFKDAEMIRLSHENMELTRQNEVLKEQLDGLKLNGFKNNHKHEDTNTNETAHHHGDCNHDHDHDHEHGHDHHHEHDHDHHHGHDHDNHHSPEYKNNKNTYTEQRMETDSCQEACESSNNVNNCTEHSKLLKTSREHHTSTEHIATAEAVEKLQARFTYLMSQVADLTDEKQRLEHLVLQLQGETETIGEYIALYQTQRRILKEREYEKAAQTRLLQEERENLRQKVSELNQLVNGLRVHERKPPAQNFSDSQAQLNESLEESLSIEPKLVEAENIADNSESVHNPLPETREILTKIQNIVSEIKENTSKEMPLVDVTNKIVDHCHCCEGQLKVV